MTSFLFLAMLWCFFHKRINFIFKTWYIGTFLVVQWSRPQASNARGQGSVPGQETGSHLLQLRIPCATPGTQHSQVNNFLKKWYIENSSVWEFRCFPEVTVVSSGWGWVSMGTVLWAHRCLCFTLTSQAACKLLEGKDVFLFTSLPFYNVIFTFYFYLFICLFFYLLFLLHSSANTDRGI